MAWASEIEASGYVGVQISQEQLNIAQPLIDIWSGLRWREDYSVGGMRKRDLYLLKLAVSYQAKWMGDQIDVLNRTDVDNVTQDGMSFSNAHVDSQLLAPLAKRCLDRLSWRKARSITPRPQMASRYSTDDDRCEWRAL